MNVPRPSRLLSSSLPAPRNSEGAILFLADRRLLLAYTRFTGGGWDHAAADIACRESRSGDSMVSGLNRLKVTQIHRTWLGL